MTTADDNNIIDEGDDDDWMSKLLNSHIFKNLPFQDIQKIFLLFEKIDVEKGEVVINQGDEGDFYYMVDEGLFRVSRKAPHTGKEFKLADIDEGKGFGEEALIGNVKRNASVTAKKAGKLTRIKKDDFLHLIINQVLDSVTFEKTRELVKDGAMCIDCRFKNEFEEAGLKLKGCINLPLNTLRMEADKLDKGKHYVVYCDNGSRSAIATFLLMERGYNVSYLQGGIDKLAPTAEKKAKPAEEKKPEAVANGDLDRTGEFNLKEMQEEKTRVITQIQSGQTADITQMSKELNKVISDVYKQMEQVMSKVSKIESEKKELEAKLRNLSKKE